MAQDNITVDGNMNVVIGSSNFGKAEDYIKANPTRFDEVLLAVRSFHVAVVSSASTKEASANEAVAKAAAVIEAAALMDPSALPHELKVALQSSSDRKLADLTAQREAIEAQIAALDRD